MLKTMSNKSITTKKADVASFLETVARTPVKTKGGASTGGRLLFAMDATASRQPSWDRACDLQASMFLSTEQLGGLSVQLCYYRGYKEFYKTAWLSNAKTLLAKMTSVKCLGGYTQIARVLQHAVTETRQRKVQAIVFIGDAIEEDVDQLCNLAGQLGILKTPVFIFQEGADAQVASVYKQIALLSGGAYCAFDENSARLLRDLLSAVAIFASGGLPALENYTKSQSASVKLLTKQLKT